MKYYIYLLLPCLLLAQVAVLSPARAADSALDLPVTTSFQVAGTATATDNVSDGISPGPGTIEMTRGDQALYVRVNAPAGNGTRLVSLDDHENGITFRNNTMLLPLYAAGVKTGALVVATDNLTADSNGYAGLITGLELDSGKIAVTRDGRNFTAGTVISLTDLPAGATYRVAFTDNVSLSAAVSADLEASGLMAAAASPPVEVSASAPAAGDAVSFVILTVEAEGNWTGQPDAADTTFYRFAGGELSRLRFSAVKSDDGRLTYQTFSPGAGQFVIVAGVPRGTAPETVTAGNSDLVLLVGLLAALVIALALMVLRVAKR